MWRPQLPASYDEVQHDIKRISPRERDLYWTSKNGAGREELLHCITDEAKRLKWLGVFNNAWATWDIKLVGDLWHTLHFFTVTEVLGSKSCFTRARIMAKPTLVNRAVSVAALIWSSAALMTLQPIALGLALLGSAAALMQNISSRRSCLRAAACLVARAGQAADLDPADTCGKTVEQFNSDTEARRRTNVLAAATQDVS